MEFKHIDDFSHYVRPDEPNVSGRSFQYIVDRHFNYIEKPDGKVERGPNDLIMAFLEVVSLVEQNVIGEIFLRSKHQNESVRHFIQNYKRVVQEVKYSDSKIGALPNYYHWYTMGAFILMVENPDVEQPKYGVSTSWDGQPPDTIKSIDSSRKEEYYKMTKTPITEEEVKEYLNCYYQKLESEFKFNQHPNVCVIVKPICVSNGKDFIPLGNLYLHFVTRTPKSEHFYYRLINDLMRAWYIEHGYDIIDEIAGFAVSDALEQPETSKEFLPNFAIGKKKGTLDNHIKDGVSLRSYYSALYLNKKKRKEFEAKREEVLKKVISHLVTIDTMKSISGSIEREFDEIRALITLTPLKQLKVEYNLELFSEILIYREVFKVGVLVFQYDPRELYIILNNLATRKVEEYIVKSSTLYRQLWSGRIIPCTDDENYQAKKIVDDIYRCLGPLEVEYLEQYKNWKHEMEED